MRLLASLLLVFVLVASKPATPDPKQELAAHMVMFLSNSGSMDAECSATAIGPHAFLTAGHCNDGDSPDDTVQFDLSLKKYHLIAVNNDHRDHVIYLTDATFTNYVDVRQRSAKRGEAVHLWGCGEMEFPPRELTGRVLKSDDKSDIDGADDIQDYSLRVIPGDSGAAIYGNDGAIVGLVTYRHSSLFGLRHTAKGFGLDFTAEALAIARTFEP